MQNIEYKGIERGRRLSPSAETGKQPSRARSESEGDQRPSRALIIAAFAAVYLIWGSTYLGIKYAIQTLPPFLMAGTRFLVAGTALCVWARIRDKGADGKIEALSLRSWRAILIVGGMLFLAGNGGVTWAEGLISSGLAALLVATEPLWIVIMNWARPGGQRPTLKACSDCSSVLEACGC